MTELKEPIVLVRQGSGEIVAYACGKCGVVASSPVRDGARAREAAFQHCAPRSCSWCGKEVDRPHYTSCDACMMEAKWMKEAEIFANANKIRPVDYGGPVFDASERTGNEGYSRDLDEALEAAADLDPDDQPFFYWTCTITKPELDAESILENLAEDAYDGAAYTHQEELQAALDAWCAKQTVETWNACYRTAVIVDWTAADAYIKTYQDKCEAKLRAEASA